MTRVANDFYEDDEDPDEIHEAFDRGDKGLTFPPVLTWTTGARYTRVVSYSYGLTWPPRPVIE